MRVGMNKEELQRFEHYLRVFLEEEYSSIKPKDWREIKLGDIFDKIYEMRGLI